MSNQEKRENNKQNQLTTQASGNAAGTVGAVGKMFGRTLLTVLVMVIVALAALGVGVGFYINSVMNEELDIDLHNLSLNYTSFIYTTNAKGKVVKSQAMYGGDNNRIWVDFEKIPQIMKDAMVAIEDKRFYEHDGVDWTRTLGAASELLSNGGSYGGSTITQQLIKNLTGENQVEITRKVKEIFRALNLEKKYSKDEILEAYLNVVNFGSGTKGVQAAANLYFNKDIKDCDVAECAAIAGITQNPYAYNPLIFPEKNKERQQVVIQEMFNQNMITKEEYDKAMKKSEKMKFYGKINGHEVGENVIFDWYTEALINDVIADLQELYQCSEDEAYQMFYYGGLKIYSAVDTDLQKKVQKIVDSSWVFENDSELEVGVYIMDYNGRVLATVGSSHEKTGNRWRSNATDAKRQVGSAMKPISVYTPAMQDGVIGYSSSIKDEALPNYFGVGRPGPNNSYGGSRGNIPVYKAVEYSSNRAAAQLCNTITPQRCYQFMTESLHVTGLTPEDGSSISAMALGGLTEGLTVKEMTAAYQIFGTKGKYYKPYTYYYIEDNQGNVILDNRNEEGDQVVSAGVAETMNKVLRNVIYGSQGTGTSAGIGGWQLYGKTGTTDSTKDRWFVGGSPYGVACVWTGYSEPRRIYNTSAPIVIWRETMSTLLSGKADKEFDFSDISEAHLCTSTGKVASSNCSWETGWIGNDRLGTICDGSHAVSRSGYGDDDEDEDSEDASASEVASEDSSSAVSSDAASSNTSSKTNSSSSKPSSSKPSSSKPSSSKPSSSKPSSSKPSSSSPSSSSKPASSSSPSSSSKPASSSSPSSSSKPASSSSPSSSSKPASSSTPANGGTTNGTSAQPAAA